MLDGTAEELDRVCTSRLLGLTKDLPRRPLQASQPGFSLVAEIATPTACCCALINEHVTHVDDFPTTP